jgi:hypothetical protein
LSKYVYNTGKWWQKGIPYIYTPITNTWIKTVSTQYAIAGASVVTLGKRVFAIGRNWNPHPTSLAAIFGGVQ